MTGILLVNYHSQTHTKMCLLSLAKIHERKRCRIYVIDNSPEDTTTDWQASGADVVLRVEGNPGFAAANNLGIKKALKDGCDYILLLNNDTEVAEDFLAPLLKRCVGKVGMVSPKIYFAAGHEYHKEYEKEQVGNVLWYAGGEFAWDDSEAFHWGVNEADRTQVNTACETGFATGCCVLTRTDVISKIGMLDESWFFGYEDTDWSLIAKKAGYQIWYEPQSVVWHYNAGSSGGSGSNLHDYFYTRNRILFAMKFAPARTKLAVIKQALIGFMTASQAVRRGMLDGLLQKGGKREPSEFQ